jgi:hypothetical protein
VPSFFYLLVYDNARRANPDKIKRTNFTDPGFICPDGVMRWELGDLPKTIQLRSQKWWNKSDVALQMQQRRFGLYYPDGTYQGRAKSVAYAMKFISDYAAKGNFGGKIDIKKANTRFGTAYEYTNDNVLMVGDLSYNANGLEFDSKIPANVMLIWNDNVIEAVPTCDVTVTLKPAEFAKEPKLVCSGVYGLSG